MRPGVLWAQSHAFVKMKLALFEITYEPERRSEIGMRIRRVRVLFAGFRELFGRVFEEPAPREKLAEIVSSAPVCRALLDDAGPHYEIALILGVSLHGPGGQKRYDNQGQRCARPLESRLSGRGRR